MKYSFGQNKVAWRRRNQPLRKSKQCGCGGSIVEKDHGTWVGWFCTKCRCGGSKSKNRR